MVFRSRAYEHLTKNEADIDVKVHDEWKMVDYVSLLWHSTDPKLLVHIRPYKTCYEIWNKALF